MKIRGLEKHIFIVALVVLLATSNSYAGGFTSRVNNLDINLEGKITHENGEILVPAKEVLEKVGAKVSNDDKSIKIELNKDILNIEFGKNKVDFNGKVKETEVPAKYSGELAYIPLKIVADELGLGLYVKQDGSFHLYNKGSIKAKVENVKSMDNIVLNINGKKESVRLIGVKPVTESGLSYIDGNYNVRKSNTAIGYLNKLILNKDVTIELDVKERDEDGKLLVYMWVGDTMVNSALIERGYARAETDLPNIKYNEDFFKLAEGKLDKNKDNNLKDKGIMTDGSLLAIDEGKVIKSFDGTINKNHN